MQIAESRSYRHLSLGIGAGAFPSTLSPSTHHEQRNGNVKNENGVRTVRNRTYRTAGNGFRMRPPCASVAPSVASPSLTSPSACLARLALSPRTPRFIPQSRGAFSHFRRTEPELPMLRASRFSPPHPHPTPHPSACLVFMPTFYSSCGFFSPTSSLFCSFCSMLVALSSCSR